LGKNTGFRNTIPKESTLLIEKHITQNDINTRDISRRETKIDRKGVTLGSDFVVKRSNISRCRGSITIMEGNITGSDINGAFVILIKVLTDKISVTSTIEKCNNRNTVKEGMNEHRTTNKRPAGGRRGMYMVRVRRWGRSDRGKHSWRNRWVNIITRDRGK